MTTRRQWHLSALSAVVSAALLVACGGGGSDQELKVGKVVSFGDSLSDLGTYAVLSSLSGPGGPPPFFAGRFTTNTFTGYTAASNSNTATNWVEWVSAKVGYPISQAVLGFATTVIPCPGAISIPSLVDSCTAYGQGGSRVTNPNGTEHDKGALTFPVVTQVANHLAKFTSFASDDIVFVWAGGNDFLEQFKAVGAELTTPATAVANMQIAGDELAALVKSQILANGARRVAVLNLPDPATIPRLAPYPAEVKALATQMAATFNDAVAAGLDGSGARIIDTRGFFAGVLANPAGYGFANVTTVACDPAKIAAVTGGRITDGSANWCNASTGQPFNGMKAGASATTWFWADEVHPTTGGQKAVGDFVITNIKNFGWIPPNL